MNTREYPNSVQAHDVQASPRRPPYQAWVRLKPLSRRYQKRMSDQARYLTRSRLGTFESCRPWAIGNAT
jgi:hypothetical protein